jgi:mannose-6-phosphate isomerase-like protein (cupin superfamily)
MKRGSFLKGSLLAIPSITGINSIIANTKAVTKQFPFMVNNGKSRFDSTVKFLGVHPNDLKISGKDTNGQLSVFEYTGLAKVGPMMHIHFKQDEIFYVVEGEYRFVVGEQTFTLYKGDTIFLPRKVPHTWIQLSDFGKLSYMLQPAGKMEEFFEVMNNLKAKPTEKEMDEIHAMHDMKVVGPPLVL